MTDTAENLDDPILYPHPLFLAEDEASEPPQVHKILIKRLDPTGWITYPGGWIQGADLVSLEQIFEQFGGGRYEITARNKEHICGRLYVTLPGRSLPLLPPGHAAPDAGAPVAVAAAAPTIGAELGSLGALLSFMGTQQQTQMEMFRMMADRDRDSAREHEKAMAMLYGSQQENTARLLGTLLEHKQSGDPTELFAKGAEMVLEMQRGAREGQSGSSEDEMDEGLAMVGKIVDLAGKAKQTGILSTAPSSPAVDAAEVES